MKIKNISGKSRLFSLGRRSLTLAANEIVTLADEPAVVQAIGEHAAAGQLQILEGPASTAALQSRAPSAAFAVRVGANTQWINGNSLNIEGAVFETSNNGTRTIAGSTLVDTAAVNSEATLATAFATALATAGAVAKLAAVGVTFTGVVVLNAKYTLTFTLDTDVVALADLTVTVTATGGVGTAPTQIKASAAGSQAAAVAVVDVVVPAGETVVVAKLPYSQLLSTPAVTVRDSNGVVQAAPTNTYISGTSIELTGLTAGHTVTIVAFVR